MVEQNAFYSHQGDLILKPGDSHYYIKNKFCEIVDDNINIIALLKKINERQNNKKNNSY